MTQSATSVSPATTSRKDLYQQVTDTIITQLEAGNIPWEKPWTGEDHSLLALPQNFTTGRYYRGINILLLWTSAINKDLPSSEWASFKQWQQKDEHIRKGEKGTMIVYYDTLDAEQENGEIKKIHFIKSSVVFNRCQLASYQPDEQPEQPAPAPLMERIDRADQFVTATGAVIEHGHSGASFVPSLDKIEMPQPERFIPTLHCTATENYYATLFHELTHWSGSDKRMKRSFGKRFGDTAYATEELVAELGAAFLCASMEITSPAKKDHAGYIAHWLHVLKENKHCIFAAASEASKAVDYLQSLQSPPQP